MIRNFLYSTLVVLSLICFSCDHNIGTKKMEVSVLYDNAKGVITIQKEDTAECKFEVKLHELLIVQGFFKDKKEMDILSLIKSSKRNIMNIAMLAAESNSELKIKLQVADVLDTIFNYRLIPQISINEDNVSFSGLGAPVIPQSKGRNLDEEIKKWLYRHHVILNDTVYNIVRKNYQYLTDSNDNGYIVKSEIPVVHSIDNHKFSVSCSMKADYYAIVACQNQYFIDVFVEKAVVNDFKTLGVSKSSLPCTCQRIKSGYLCIFLLGINKDYSYQQLPISVIAIDNSAPERGYYSDKVPSSMPFKNGTKIIIPKSAPKIDGSGTVYVDHWAGNGLECNVTFNIEMSGDCKSVTIQRRGELCYPDRYLGNHLRPEDKVFYAKDNLSQRFTWKMHFDDGDNEIPIVTEDYHGNKSTYKVVVRAKFVRSNSPHIDIENNIYN